MAPTETRGDGPAAASAVEGSVAVETFESVIAKSAKASAGSEFIRTVPKMMAEYLNTKYAAYVPVGTAPNAMRMDDAIIRKIAAISVMAECTLGGVSSGDPGAIFPSEIQGHISKLNDQLNVLAGELARMAKDSDPACSRIIWLVNEVKRGVKI